ncbi:HD-GYP domain-containing protein [Halalkalibacterium ligniniphilum]|uniref:HD-GYP domain-containing protein n=1 Tax=Halalkalibacterium ligniniphilum TaxID=1134413 RepID=UPI000345B56E|nr:HD domain-containing phosphohydrolase [Halalkalibacterium ligniniphilum]
MRLITINEYDENTMELAKPIYDSRKRVLLGTGAKVHPKYMEKLKEIGIKYLFVEDAKSKGISLDEMIEMSTWLDTIATVERAFMSSAKKEALPLVEIQKAIKKLVEEIKLRKAIILIPTSAIDTTLSPFAHAVNVTLISLQIGKHLGYTNHQLHDLGIGSLLHDIGKSQSTIREEHPEKGFNIIRSHRELSLMSAHVAYQHHETMDGQGFPRKLKGNEMIEFAHVCSIANYFENLISHEGMAPHEAIEKMMTLSDTVYPHGIVLAFSQSIIAYPPGTHVKLSNNESGIVTRIESHLQRPFVRLDSSGEEIDLSEKVTILIEEVIIEKKQQINT